MDFSNYSKGSNALLSPYGTVIAIIGLTFAFTAAYILYHTYSSSGKNPRLSSRNTGQQIQILASSASEIVERYNNMVRIYNATQKKMMNIINSTGDYQTLYTYADIVSEIDHNCTLMLGKADELNDQLAAKSTTLIPETLDEMELLMVRIQTGINELNDLEFTEPSYAPAAADKIYSDSLFTGCSTADAVEKRYKALAKAFHPDMGYGDNSMFTKLQHQYEQRKQELMI